MPKHKKTREQKMRADERRVVLPSLTYSLPTASSHVFQKKNSSAVTTHAISLDHFVQKDLQKTALISSAILILQLVLFFLLKNHLLAIGFVSY